MTAGIYARVSTLDQEPENQFQELRRYVAARGIVTVSSLGLALGSADSLISNFS
jgi:DNA invertase Pin-like site-specific DNA recombinase